MKAQGELEQIPLPFQQHMSTLENRIMADLVNRLKANQEITSTADWQINRLRQLGLSNDYIRKQIQEAVGLTDAEIEKLYGSTIKEDYIRNRDIYKKRGKKFLPFEDNRELQRLISATKQQAMGDFRNITNTLGFAIRGPDGKIQHSPLENFYQDTLDAAMLDIGSGSFDYNTVLKRTIQTMTNSGVRSIDYDSGRSYRVDVAARMCIMTGFNQVQRQMNDQVAKDLGTDYFEVSWHGGARPTHQVWQGKVYSRRELENVCQLGSPGGLCGVHCYHNYDAFIPGISARTYTDDWLNQMNRQENEPKSYGGKEYTTYEALQEQRKLERLMRKQRQDIKLLQTGKGIKDDILAAQSRYHITMDNYAKFSGAMKLPQQRDRIFQDGLGRMASRKEVAKIAKPGYNTSRVQDSKSYVAAIRSEEKKIRSDKIETAVLLNDRGDIIFRESSGATNYVEFSKEQLSKMKGATLTHNHPSNSTFSAEDLALMTIHELKAIRATGKERTFQLSKMSNGDLRNDLAVDYKIAMADNKKITDVEYERLTKQYDNGNIGHTEYSEKLQGLNVRLNQLNSKWLKENSKKYGYRYSVIERRRKGNA